MARRKKSDDKQSRLEFAQTPAKRARAKAREEEHAAAGSNGEIAPPLHRYCLNWFLDRPD